MSGAPREHWAVTVWRNGEAILTIESNMLSGRDLSPEDVDCVRRSALHLASFIGQAPAPEPEKETT